MTRSGEPEHTTAGKKKVGWVGGAGRDEEVGWAKIGKYGRGETQGAEFRKAWDRFSN